MRFSASIVLPFLAATSYAQLSDIIGGAQSLVSALGINTSDGVAGIQSQLATITNNPAALSSLAAFGSKVRTELPSSLLNNPAVSSAIGALPTSEQGAIRSLTSELAAGTGAAATAASSAATDSGNSGMAVQVPAYSMGLSAAAVVGILGAAVML